MNMKEPTLWRWSHARHHTDTIIVGRDREILAMRPPDALRLVVNVIGVRDALDVVIECHPACRRTPDRRGGDVHPGDRASTRVSRGSRVGGGVPRGDRDRDLPRDRATADVRRLPSLYGRWLAHYFAFTQHAGLAENVLDHRLNSRTVYMNRVLRFLYWNMNYHIEHHMFPMVPYHALPSLHAELRADLPVPCRSTIAAYREILPALRRQLRDPEYYIERELPASAKPFRPDLHRVVLEGAN